MEKYDNLIDIVGYEWYMNITQQKVEEYKHNIFNPQDMFLKIQETIDIERPHRKTLIELAKRLIKQEFTVINDLKIKFDLELTEHLKNNNFSSEQEDDDNDFDEDMILEIQKRRLINAITQGASANVLHLSYLIKDEINEINSNLLELYKTTDTNKEFMWNLNNEFLKEMIIQGLNNDMIHGISQVDYINDNYVITAKAVTFNLLLHEMVKGIYEVLSIHGMTINKEKNQKIVNYCDYIGNEPEDLKYGEIIYNEIREFFYKNFEKDLFNYPELREYYIVALYYLKPKEFISVVQNILNKNYNTINLYDFIQRIKETTDHYIEWKNDL